MSDPTKYYEAQSSGLGTMTEKRFPEPSLPVIIEFPKNWNVERRLQWYNENNFYSTSPISDGDAHKEWQTKIDTAYAGSGKWRRGALMGPWRPEEGVSIEEATRSAPIIDAESLAIRFELIPENTVLGLDLGKTVGEYGGELGVVNYSKDPSRAKRADVITNYIASDGKTITRNLYPNISHTALPAKGIDFAVTSGVPSAPEQRPAGTDRDRQLIEAQAQQAYEQDINLEQRKSRVKDYLISRLGYKTQEEIEAQRGNWDVQMSYKKEDGRNVLKNIKFANIDGSPPYSYDDATQLQEIETESINYSLQKYFKPTETDPSAIPEIPGIAGIPTPPMPPGFTEKGGVIPSFPYPTQAGAVAGYGQAPTGAALGVPGFPTGANIDARLRMAMTPSQVSAGLAATLPGSDVAAIRGLYQTPLKFAQTAYDLDVLRGTFQPPMTTGIGGQPSAGGFGFQQYLGGQPNWMQSLQQGLQAIDQVKQKISSGISPNQLIGAERNIYDTYIGGTTTDPFQGARAERELRKSLTDLLPYQLRNAASRNVMNMYNRQLNTPSNLIGMPGGSFNYGQSTNPFIGRSPMQMGATTNVAQIPTGQSVSMDTMGENTAVTGTGTTTTTASDGSTVQFKPTGDGTGTTATIVSKPTTSSRMGVSGVNTKSHGIVMTRKDAQGKVEEIWQLVDGKKVAVDITPSELGVPLSDQVINQRAIQGYGANDSLSHLITGVGEISDEPPQVPGWEETPPVPDAITAAKVAAKAKAPVTPITTVAPISKVTDINLTKAAAAEKRMKTGELAPIPKAVTTDTQTDFDIDPSKKVISEESWQTPESLWRDEAAGYPTLTTTTKTTRGPYQYTGPTWKDLAGPSWTDVAGYAKTIGSKVLASSFVGEERAKRFAAIEAAKQAAKEAAIKSSLPPVLGPPIPPQMAMKNQQDLINQMRALDAARGIYTGVGGGNIPPINWGGYYKYPEWGTRDPSEGAIGAIPPNPLSPYTSKAFWPGLFNKSNISFKYR